MKEGIHPKYYEVEARCSCGTTWKTRSTNKELHLEICSGCHPFYTGARRRRTRKAEWSASSASTAPRRSRRVRPSKDATKPAVH